MQLSGQEYVDIYAADIKDGKQPAEELAAVAPRQAPARHR